MAEIALKHVSKSFGSTKVIEDLSLTLRSGAFTVLLGPSGCGKTTLLRMIAGIGPPTSGQVWIDGVDITDVPPGRRNVAMVFQSYAIYPTMTVRENIEFCLKNNKVPKAERKRRVEQVAKTVGLEEYLGRKPAQLSGGQRQRIALARALVKNPAVFLMDEPLSNLDAKLRTAMRSELIQLHQELGATFVYVTHDQVESMAMADHIVLMNAGKIMQQGAPEVIYQDPDNIFTAQFIGTPPTNILPVRGQTSRLGYRPENVSFLTDEATAVYTRRGSIVTREMLGAEVLYKVRIAEGDVMVRSTCFQYSAGDVVRLGVDESSLYFFDKEGQRIREGCGALLSHLEEAQP